MIILDGARMDSRADLHAELREKLSLPDYYGGNLDALNDCLGEFTERQLVVIENAEKMRRAGADIFVAGSSSVFAKGGSIEENTAKLREAFSRGEKN